MLSGVILVFAGALGIVAPLIFDELDRFVVDMPRRFDQLDFVFGTHAE